MSSFQDLGVVPSQSWLGHPKGLCAQAALNYKTETEHPSNFFGLLPQGYYERKPLNIEETTSSVLFVLLLLVIFIMI